MRYALWAAGAVLLLAVGCGSVFRAAPPGTSPPGEGQGAGNTGALPTLVAEGRRWWTRSPDPRNPVACATCHHDPAPTRGWAASFPKFKPLPPPHARVMTLLQANAEVLARHYRVADALEAARGVTAYLTAHGAGVPISPGVSAGQPVFPDRMRRLAASTARGAALFGPRCAGCHGAEAVAPAVAAFPRLADGRPETLEEFLERHQPAGKILRWDGQEVADVIAHLTSLIAGRPAGSGLARALSGAKE